MMDALFGSVDGAHYETAGALGNGDSVGTCEFKPGCLRGDKPDRPSPLLHWHDGCLSHQYRIILTHIVFENTLTAALSEKPGQNSRYGIPRTGQ
jgi:hypothetical protein